MISDKDYNRERAVLYAQKYALTRNPLYFTFDGIGGNCTNFVSQCVLAGSCVMNFTPTFGWYYLSVNSRSPSWTGVDFFYDFIINNDGLGPYAKGVPLSEALVGDIIQLKNKEGFFYHTLIISEIREDGEILVCANSIDSLNRPLSTYKYASLRAIHIIKIRYDTEFVFDCFETLYNPVIGEPYETGFTEEAETQIRQEEAQAEQETERIQRQEEIIQIEETGANEGNVGNVSETNGSDRTVEEPS